ncbi:hypothetical protein GSS88_00130 [Corynebacterium sp. 3HC-13]|uniref:hypothetical protein n=1 Tax=Corynebacterium poyangense TaxID=2684405 RepID=UPI001CCEA61A|nr:hypothetical protein [Corynebacterium poyangense]MBZ8176217.1 hypothetical protein [Corynebacterium poyangense]
MNEKKLLNLLIGVVAVLAVLAVIVVYFVWDSATSDHAASQGQTQGTAPVQAGKDPDCAESPGGNCPGAMVGNTQRQWPDPKGYFDDSAFATPGTYTVDRSPRQNPLWIPVNHDGDLPKVGDLEQGMGQCEHKETILLPGKTQNQYVNARYLTVNDKSGPTTMVNGIPWGYAHSPAGAVMAAASVFGYAIRGQYDGIGLEAEKQVWSSLDGAQEKLAEPDHLSEKSRKGWRVLPLPGPIGYRFITCSENAVVVEIIQQETKDGFPVFRTPLIWRDNDWHADFTGLNDKDIMRHVKTNNGFTEVKYE